VNRIFNQQKKSTELRKRGRRGVSLHKAKPYSISRHQKPTDQRKRSQTHNACGKPARLPRSKTKHLQEAETTRSREKRTNGNWKNVARYNCAQGGTQKSKEKKENSRFEKEIPKLKLFIKKIRLKQRPKIR